MKTANGLILDMPEIPDYQRKAITYLEGFNNTGDLRKLLWRFRFSEAEIERILSGCKLTEKKHRKCHT